MSWFTWLVCIVLFVVILFYFVLNSGILSCPVCKQTCFARNVVENFFLKDFATGSSAMAKVSENQSWVPCELLKHNHMNTVWKQSKLHIEKQTLLQFAYAAL